MPSRQSRKTVLLFYSYTCLCIASHVFLLRFNYLSPCKANIIVSPVAKIFWIFRNYKHKNIHRNYGSGVTASMFYPASSQKYAAVWVRGGWYMQPALSRKKHCLTTVCHNLPQRLTYEWYVCQRRVRAPCSGGLAHGGCAQPWYQKDISIWSVAAVYGVVPKPIICILYSLHMRCV